MTNKEMITAINALMQKSDGDYKRTIVLKNSITRHCKSFAKDFRLNEISDETFEQIMKKKTPMERQEFFEAVKQDYIIFAAKEMRIKALSNCGLAVDYITLIKLITINDLPESENYNKMREKYDANEEIYLVKTVNPRKELFITKDNKIFEDNLFTFEKFKSELRAHIKVVNIHVFDTNNKEVK